MKYVENQAGWPIVFPVAAMMIFLFLAWYYSLGSNPLPAGVMAGMEAMLAVVLLLFFRMRIEVDRREIVVSYGIGLIRKRIVLETISELSVVRNSWIYGLGIRVMPGGIIYNIMALDAVELKLHGRKSFIRIGTPDPGRLVSVIKTRLSHQK